MIDWSRVEDLRSEIGIADFMEVVDLFLEETDGSVDRLAAGLAPAAVEGELHFLKGSALNLGFGALAALCQDGERCASGGHSASVELERIVQCYAQSKQAFLAGLARLDAA